MVDRTRLFWRKFGKTLRDGRERISSPNTQNPRSNKPKKATYREGDIKREKR